MYFLSTPPPPPTPFSLSLSMQISDLRLRILRCFELKRRFMVVRYTRNSLYVRFVDVFSVSYIWINTINQQIKASHKMCMRCLFTVPYSHSANEKSIEFSRAIFQMIKRFVPLSQPSFNSKTPSVVFSLLGQMIWIFNKHNFNNLYNVIGISIKNTIWKGVIQLSIKPNSAIRIISWTYSID